MTAVRADGHRLFDLSGGTPQPGQDRVALCSSDVVELSVDLDEQRLELLRLALLRELTEQPSYPGENGWIRRQ